MRTFRFTHVAEDSRMNTLVDTVYPRKHQDQAIVRDALLIVAGSALVALCAKVQIPMWPAPMTLQPFAVLLVGAVLGSRRGGLALIAYLLEGAAGLPVFAHPIAGLAYFVGPTAGYLFAFPIAAYVVGRLCEQGWDRRFSTAAAAMAIGHGIILGLGFLWLTPILGPKAAFTGGVLQYLPGDVIKIAAAAAALPAVWKIAAKQQ
jgi:biotin transport system substrate-specific component